MGISAIGSAAGILLAATRVNTRSPVHLPAPYVTVTFLSSVLIAFPFVWLGWKALRDATWVARPAVVGAVRGLAWLAVAEAVVACLMVLPMAHLPGLSWILFFVGATPIRAS